MAVTEEVVKPVEETPAAATTTATTTVNPYDYNSRINEINRMYDSYANSQKTALESAYNQNLSNLEANRAKIAQQYQTQRNMNAVNFERNRRNFNQQAAMNGLNTGAGSQAALAQMNQYQGGMAQLGAAEANANNDLQKSIADLKVKYEADVNEAISKNDYNRAAALLDEYNNAYSQAMTKAQTLAQYGDFSGYSAIYGEDSARQMSAAWEIQNPLLAYNLGRINAGRYRAITGAYPPGYSTGGGGGRSSGGYYRTSNSRSGEGEGEGEGEGGNGGNGNPYGIGQGEVSEFTGTPGGGGSSGGGFGGNGASTPRNTAPTTSGRSVAGSFQSMKPNGITATMSIGKV